MPKDWMVTAEAPPPIILEIDPVPMIPDDTLILIGKIMAWSAYIETALFNLYLHAKKGNTVARRRQFYKKTAGMHARIRLVREAFDGKLPKDLDRALNAVLDEAKHVAAFRNDWAHNPLLIYGPKDELFQWQVASGDFAGNVRRVQSNVVEKIFPHLKRLYTDINNLSALINDPSGRSYAVAFGEMTEQMEKQAADAMKIMRERARRLEGEGGPA